MSMMSPTRYKVSHRVRLRKSSSRPTRHARDPRCTSDTHTVRNPETSIVGPSVSQIYQEVTRRPLRFDGSGLDKALLVNGLRSDEIRVRHAGVTNGRHADGRRGSRSAR